MIPETTVFISYSSVDRPFARRLNKDLQRHGVQVWIDEDGIAPGDTWRDKIEEAISEVDYLLVILSSSSVRSRWVRHEVKEALQEGLHRDVKVVPVLLEECPVPRYLKDRQIVDLSGEAYRRQLERLIRSFSMAWTIPRFRVKPWTKKRSRLALRIGLLTEVEGRLEFTSRVAERLRLYASRWIRGLPVHGGSRIFQDWQEYSGVALWHSTKESNLSQDQEDEVLSEAHSHLLEFLLDLAVRAGVMEADGEQLSINWDIGDEVSEIIPRIEELGYADEVADGRSAVALAFIEMIRSRLVDRVPRMASFAEPLGTVLLATFGFWTGPGHDVDDDDDPESPTQRKGTGKRLQASKQAPRNRKRRKVATRKATKGRK